ncbi:MAG: hypothetical protein AAF250_12315 [Pseudomonadota bacterium]
MSISRWRTQYRKFKRTLPKDTSEETALSNFLETRIRSNTYRKKVNTQRISRNRARAENRRIIKKLRANRGNFVVADNPRLLLFRNKASHIRDTLAPNYESHFKDIVWRLRNRRTSEIDLRDFSFARNPKGTLKMIRRLVRLASTELDVRINFLDSQCDDVAPYIVLSQIIRTLPPVFSGGKIHPEVAAVLESVGLSGALGIGKIMRRKATRPLVMPFKMRSRTPPRHIRDPDFQLKPQAKEDVSDAFCNTLNDWLEAYDLELTPNAEMKLVDSINEALDNAERHGVIGDEKLAGEWLIGGFSRIYLDDDGPSQIRCSFSIVSVGKSIAETLQTSADDVLERIKAYAHKHGGLPKHKENMALLTTVMALQDGVTRLADASEEGRGGVGMMELVDIFADLGDTTNDELQSVFTVLSGRSCIRITRPYRSGRPGAKPHLKELWFNPENDMNSPPSPEHVFCVADRFAGTVLSASFVLDRAFLTQRYDD